MKIQTVGSICSGIEAASVAWKGLDWDFCWFSEIADFPSRLLAEKYPTITNVGDMNDIPQKITSDEIESPDLICGGTPCQAFSLAGSQNGLNDDRGNLTLKFVDIIEANDAKRLSKGKARTIVFWENVEGVLTDKTNAFGCLLSSLAGLQEVLTVGKWPNSGIIHGPKRNIAWRILDAKFFGLPQQRRRLYVMAGGKDFFPENVLLEDNMSALATYPHSDLVFNKDGHSFELFREYTDCLYSSYGTKWNGNAAAYNGSLFVVQDGRIRRLTPLECERLMGFPDNYTLITNSEVKKTNRYQGVGNSWAVPVVGWIGKRLKEYTGDKLALSLEKIDFTTNTIDLGNGYYYADFGKGLIPLPGGKVINCTVTPEECTFGKIEDVISTDAEEELYISPVGCYGMVRRKEERNLHMNKRLEEVLRQVSSQMSMEEIEKRSRVQKRGRFSTPPDNTSQKETSLVSEIPEVCSRKDEQQLTFNFG
ncbi:MAG: restriction endonuclease subunit M [Lentisphaerae bacterium]|nr:restriction endonuclease subunit M [Lentisphaerota bacterium]